MADSDSRAEDTRLRRLVRDVAAVARERHLGVKAAGLAYHAFNTLVPLVILALVGAALVDSLEPLLAAVAEAAGLGGTGLDGAAAAANGSARTRAAVLALCILLWSAVRLFQAINSAFTDVYGSRKDASYVDAATTVTLVTALYIVLVTVTLSLGVALISVVGMSLSALGGGVAVTAGGAVLLTGLLTGVFLPMYYLFPQADVSVREVIPGTAFAALSWTILAGGFRLYVATSESVALFGVAGAVLLILTWIYLGGFCLLLGAVLNAVLAGRVEPEDGWVPMRDVWSEYAGVFK